MALGNTVEVALSLEMLLNLKTLRRQYQSPFLETVSGTAGK